MVPVGAGEAVVDGADLVGRADDVAAVVPDEVRGRVLPGAEGGFERAKVFRVDDGIPGEAGWQFNSIQSFVNFLWLFR